MATQPIPKPAPDVRGEIRRTEQTFAQAFNTGDLDTVINFYTEDASVLPAHNPLLEGRTATRDFFQKMQDAGASDLQLELGRIEESGDLVVHAGRYTVNAPDPKGGTRPEKGKFVAVYRRQSDGSLQLVIDTWNSDLPLE